MYVCRRLPQVAQWEDGGGGRGRPVEQQLVTALVGGGGDGGMRDRHVSLGSGLQRRADTVADDERGVALGCEDAVCQGDAVTHCGHDRRGAYEMMHAHMHVHTGTHTHASKHICVCKYACMPESSTVSNVSLCQRHVMAAPPSAATVASDRTLSQLDTAPTPMPAVLVGCAPKSIRSFEPDDEKRAELIVGT